jgi:predicted PurR-regulated permease PerM
VSGRLAAALAGAALLLLILWFAADLLLLVFAGLLVSILLRGLSRNLRKYLHVGRGLSLLLVSLALLASVAGIVWLGADQVGTQASELQQQLPQALDSVRKWIERYPWARDALHNLPNPAEWLARRSATVIDRFTGLASATLGAAVNAVLILVIGLYLASQPELYSHGLKRLIPMRHRARAGEVLSAIDDALWRWLIWRERSISYRTSDHGLQPYPRCSWACSGAPGRLST